MGEVIDILKNIKTLPKEEKYPFEEAIEDFQQFPENKQNNMLCLISTALFMEIKAGISGEKEYEDAPFFKIVDQMYEGLKPKGCYFCDENIDGNAQEFNRDQKVCLTCRLKIANLLQALGIPSGRVFPYQERKVQKTKL